MLCIALSAIARRLMRYLCLPPHSKPTAMPAIAHFAVLRHPMPPFITHIALDLIRVSQMRLRWWSMSISTTTHDTEV